MKIVTTTLVAAAFAMTAWSAHAVDLPGPLVDTDWLEKNLGNVVVLDVRKSHEGAQLIPGSVAVPWKDVRVKAQTDKDGEVHDDLLPSKDAFEAMMRSLGVSNDSTIVISHTGANASDVYNGTRLYWTLKYYGHDTMALLDGGTAKWAVEKRTMVPQPRIPEAGTFAAKAERRHLLATSADVVDAVNNNSANLVDSRGEHQFLGLGHRTYVSAAGHIKGAVNMQPANWLVDPSNGAKSAPFYSTDTLRMLATSKGIDGSKPVITYCDSGHLSSGSWFVLSEILGQKAAMYDGSMHAFTKSPDRLKMVEKLN